MSALRKRPHRRRLGELTCFNLAVQKSALCAFLQAPFAVTVEEQALPRVIHLTSLGHLSQDEMNYMLEVPGLFH